MENVATNCGLALQTRITGEYVYGLFKAAATRASVIPGPFREFYQRSLARGIKPTMVRLTLARKIAAITLILWKKGARPAPLGWLYNRNWMSKVNGEYLAGWRKLKSDTQGGSTAKAAYLSGAFLPAKGAWLWYWRL